MQYRLRTLLIVITVFCIYAAWAGYMRTAAAFHRQEADRITRMLARGTNMPAKEVEVLVTNIASHSKGRVDSLSFGVVDPFLGDSLLAEHRKAVNHTILASTYEQSIFRPWKIFGATFTP